MSSASRTSSIGVVTCAWNSTTRDQHIIKYKVATISTPTQDIVIGRSRSRRPRHILEKKVGDGNPIGRVTSRTSVQIILPNINAVRLNPANGDIAVCDIWNETSRVVVGFYARSICGIDDLAVGELSSMMCEWNGEPEGQCQLLTRIFATLLFLFPPTEPIIIPRQPEQHLFETVILLPLVMAT